MNTETEAVADSAPSPQTKYPDLMIDIETLGTSVRAPITQIGLVAFDLRRTIALGATLEIDVSPDLAEPFRADIDTIRWWMKQSDEARAHLHDEREREITVGAMFAVGRFVSAHCTPDVSVWAKPPDFDISILTFAMQHYGVAIPWRYNRTRCVRTILDLADMPPHAMLRPLVAHSALSDAIAQATNVCRAYSAIDVLRNIWDDHGAPPKDV